MSPEKEPVVNWPEKDGKYKVVQLYVEGEPFLRYQEPEFPSHSTTLVRALRSFGIKFDTEKTTAGYKIAARKGKNYEVAGMGNSEVNVKEKKASFSGVSADYEIGIDLKHLNKIIELEKDWEIEYTGFQVP